VTENAGFAITKVTDTGMGIGVADQKQLFQRFFRTDEATSKGIAGTGLGLWITKSIIEAHKGRLTVESEKGVGTTFQIDLPKRAPPVEPSRPTRRMPWQSSRSLSPARSH
jgi:signal transduction histidine kinase